MIRRLLSRLFLYAALSCSLVTATAQNTELDFLAPVTPGTFDPVSIAIHTAYQSAGATLTFNEKQQINTLVVGMKTNGIFTKLDVFGVEMYGVVIDWINIARTITLFNSPASKTYMGFYWNGTNTYANTGFNPATNGINYTLNNASLFVYLWKGPDVGATASIDLGIQNSTLAQINISATQTICALNSGVPSSFSIVPSQKHGWWSVDRSSSSDVKVYRNGVEINAQSTASSSIPNGNMFWGARSNSGTPAGFSSSISKIYAAGASLRSAQSTFYTLISNFITGITPSLDLSYPLMIGMYGQSNAKGTTSTACIPSDLIPDISSNFRFYGNPTNTQFTDGNWAIEQVGILETGLYGVDRRLLRSLSDHYASPGPRPNIYLLNTGQNGTSLSASWVKGATGSAYLSAKQVYDYAFAKMPETAPFKVVVWIQGEADASGGAPAYNSYEERLADLILRIRADYNLPNLIFITVSLSSTQTAVDPTGRTVVNTAMSTTVGNVARSYYISQNATSDGTHYDCAGLDTIAGLVYTLMISLN